MKNIKDEIKKIINSCNCYNKDTGEWGFDNETAVEKLIKFVVIKQREILIDFAKYSEDDRISETTDECVDNYLDSIK